MTIIHHGTPAEPAAWQTLLAAVVFGLCDTLVRIVEAASGSRAGWRE